MLPGRFFSSSTHSHSVIAIARTGGESHCSLYLCPALPHSLSSPPISPSCPPHPLPSSPSPPAVLLWMITAASIKVGRPHVARRAIDVAERRLCRDGWPEYYDGKLGRYVGKQARKLQTWSIAGYLVAKMMLEDPSHLGMVSLEEEKIPHPVITRSHSWKF